MTNGSSPSAPPATAGAPPHSIEAEQSVLGAILLSERVHYALVIEEALRPDDFYRERHRVIYESMMALYEQSEPIDVLTVTERLRSRGKLDEAGGQAEIDALTASVPAVGNLRRYGQIVKEHSLLRRVLGATYEIQASVHNHDGDPREIVERAEKTMLEVAHDDRQKDFRQVGEVLHEEIDKWQILSVEGRSITGTASGFADLDAITGGFQAGNLIIVAARPSMGKSALVTNIAENVALNKERPRPVALFSLEMSEAELAQRFIASQAAIKGDDLRKGRLKDESKWRRVLKVAGEYDRSPLFVDDSSDIGILDVRAKARRLHQQTMREHGGLGLIVVDYLQLMRADSRIENRVQQVGEMSRGLKILARELNVPVIALSQLSRGVESRTDKRPMLSDLRECVTGDTLVVLADGRRVPIRDLVGTSPEVVAVDHDDRLVRARSDKVWPVGRRPVLRVHLASGRTLRATGEHRIRTDAGWQTVAGLVPGDRAALASRLPEPESPERLPEQELAMLGRCASQDGLPPDVFRLGEDQVAELLRHLWASGGVLTSAPRPDGRRLARVAFRTSSGALAADVGALLLRLRIVARLTTTRGDDGAEHHNVAVSGPADQRRFLDLVGAEGRHAPDGQRLRALLAATAPSFMTTTIGSAAVLEAPLSAPAPAGDLCWDRVVEVVLEREEEVFDLTVPGPACWLADGIVSHNSGQIEQDADLVMFIYRDEYYNAETTDRPGEADLIIAKHRNGGLGDVPLTFQNEYPRFLGLQRAA